MVLRGARIPGRAGGRPPAGRPLVFFHSKKRLEKPLKGELAVYNVLGHKVKTLASGSFSGGEHAVVWNGRDERGEPLSSGVYFYRLVAETLVQTRKMVLIK